MAIGARQGAATGRSMLRPLKRSEHQPRTGQTTSSRRTLGWRPAAAGIVVCCRTRHNCPHSRRPASGVLSAGPVRNFTPFGLTTLGVATQHTPCKVMTK